MLSPYAKYFIHCSNGVGGILCLAVHESIRACVYDHVLEVCYHDINCLCEFHQTLVQLGTDVNRLDFEVKVQGHSEAVCNFLVKSHRLTVCCQRSSSLSGKHIVVHV